MQKIFPGTMQLFHVHHNIHLPGNQLNTNKSLTQTNLLNVRNFIANNQYPNATIINHKQINKECPIIPSAMLAAKIALENDADFHVWLEDDAILLDTTCNQWHHQIINEIGSYRNTNAKKMLVCAYFISKPSFDQRLINELITYRSYPTYQYLQYGSQYEHFLYMLAGQKMSLLPENYAFRHHLYSTYTKDKESVANWLKNNIPEITDEDLSLLNLDFGF